MQYPDVKLHLFCGRVASGKSSLAASLGNAAGAVVLCEDDWLHRLFGDQMKSLDDFVRFSARLRDVIGPHVVDLLRAGTTVVLDFHGNTPESRAWMMGLIEESGVRHVMHVMDLPIEESWRRLEARNANGGNPFKVSRAQFDRVNRHFSVPSDGEGFNVVWLRRETYDIR